MPSWVARGAMIGAGLGGAMGAMRHQRGQSWAKSIGGGAAMGALAGGALGMGGRMTRGLYRSVGIPNLKNANSIIDSAYVAGLSMRASAAREGQELADLGRRSAAQIGKLPLGAKWAKKMDGLGGARAGRLSAARATRIAQGRSMKRGMGGAMGFHANSWW